LGEKTRWNILAGGGVPAKRTLPLTVPPELTEISSYPQLRGWIKEVKPIKTPTRKIFFINPHIAGSPNKD
jgi:hypothetical protein